MAKRLRIFAGPNGSGKTSLKKILEDKKLIHLYKYFNADDLLKEISEVGYYKLYKGESFEDLKNFAAASTYKSDVKKPFANGSITSKGRKLFFAADACNSYTVSLLVSFRCEILLELGESLSLETVFSSKEKLSLIESAKKRGYKVYIYCIATEDPDINKGRIATRVADGGHNVSVDKIFSRYSKSLQNVASALSITDRAFFWDNTTEETKFIASYDKDASKLDVKVLPSETPKWFTKHILDYLVK